MHRAAGVPVAVAGNVGTPLASLVGSVAPDAVIVCEASSFQLEDTVAFAPECAVLLNVEPDHLDRHGTFEAYRDAKMRVFANQGPATWRSSRRFRRCPIAADELAAARRAQRRERAGGRRRPRSRARSRRTRWPRRCARSAACRTGSRRWPSRAAWSGSTTPRRPTSRRRGVGIEAFDGGVHLIAGGSLKGGGFEGLRDPVAVALQGRLPDRRGERAAGRRPRGRPGCRLERCGDLERAVAAAGGGGRARRCGSALAGLRQLRPVRGLRGARSPFPRAGAAGAARDEFALARRRNAGWREAARARAQAPARVLAALHGDALPARARGDHGLLGELGGVAARRLRRPVLLPKRYVALAIVGLVVLHFASRHGLAW